MNKLFIFKAIASSPAGKLKATYSNATKRRQRMICTIYSHNIGFDKILDIVRRIYPSGKLDINSEDEFQVVTIEIKGGFFKSSKKIKIPYRQCNGHLPQITDSY